MASVNELVLVADDDAESFSIIAAILATRGYRVHPAESSEGVLASIQVDPPDIILLDPHLPQPEGFELARVLRTDEVSRHIPLILLGGSTSEQERADAFALGAVDFVGKPVCSAELLARLATHLELARFRMQAGNDDGKRSSEQAQSAQKLQSIGLLAAGIGHDFKNILSGILASLDSLLDDFAAPSPTREQLQRIHSVVDRAVEIVRELLIYAGGKVAGFETVNLVRLAEEMIELLNISVSKRARLNIRFSPNLPAVRANPVQIRQVLMNLIINASEALDGEVGEIFLTLGPGPARLCGRSAAPGECDWVRLAVRDTGNGMSEEVRQRIFDPFFTTKANGRGLGLSMVRGIVRAHGGLMTVTSSPGNGCSFEILLPPAPHAGACDQDRAAAGASTNGKSIHSTVLIVEDELDLRRAVAGLLRGRGIGVMETGDGSSAIDLLRRHPCGIDTVLLDANIPGTSSRDILWHMKSARPEIRIVLTSAYGYEAAIAAVGDQCPWEFLRKPYRLQEIIELLGAAHTQVSYGQGSRDSFQNVKSRFTIEA